MGNGILREISENVTLSELGTQIFNQTIDSLITIMRKNNGVGIAAPQIGVLKRVFLIEVDSNPNRPKQKDFPLTIFINPTLTSKSKKLIEGWEGCLSMPGLSGVVRRHEEVTIRHINKSGEIQNTILSGFPAIIAQHEIDHLDGVLFIDRMKSLKSLKYRDSFIKQLIKFQNV